MASRNQYEEHAYDEVRPLLDSWRPDADEDAYYLTCHMMAVYGALPGFEEPRQHAQASSLLLEVSEAVSQRSDVPTYFKISASFIRYDTLRQVAVKVRSAGQMAEFLEEVTPYLPENSDGDAERWILDQSGGVCPVGMMNCCKGVAKVAWFVCSDSDRPEDWVRQRYLEYNEAVTRAARLAGSFLGLRGVPPEIVDDARHPLLLVSDFQRYATNILPVRGIATGTAYCPADIAFLQGFWRSRGGEVGFDAPEGLRSELPAIAHTIGVADPQTLDRHFSSVPRKLSSFLVTAVLLERASAEVRGEFEERLDGVSAPLPDVRLEWWRTSLLAHLALERWVESPSDENRRDLQGQLFSAFHEAWRRAWVVLPEEEESLAGMHPEPWDRLVAAACRLSPERWTALAIGDRAEGLLMAIARVLQADRAVLAGTASVSSRLVDENVSSVLFGAWRGALAAARSAGAVEPSELRSLLALERSLTRSTPGQNHQDRGPVDGMAGDAGVKAAASSTGAYLALGAVAIVAALLLLGFAVM